MHHRFFERDHVFLYICKNCQVFLSFFQIFMSVECFVCTGSLNTPTYISLLVKICTCQFSFLEACIPSINHLHTMTKERFGDGGGGGPSSFVISENLYLLYRRQLCQSCIVSIVQNTPRPPSLGLFCIQNVW